MTDKNQKLKKLFSAENIIVCLILLHFFLFIFGVESISERWIKDKEIHDCIDKSLSSLFFIFAASFFVYKNIPEGNKYRYRTYVIPFSIIFVLFVGYSLWERRLVFNRLDVILAISNILTLLWVLIEGNLHRLTR